MIVFPSHVDSNVPPGAMKDNMCVHILLCSWFGI